MPEIESLNISAERHWARPHPADQGDPTPEPIYTSVGHALSEWESAEASLAYLFIALSQANIGHPLTVLRRTYGAISLNPGRRQAVEFAAEIYFGQDWRLAKVDLRRLLTHVEHASKRRDDIAHGFVTDYENTQTSRGYFLIPPAYNARLNFAYRDFKAEEDSIKAFAPKYRYTSQDIVSLSRKFTALQTDIFLYELSVFRTEDGNLNDEFLDRITKPRK